MFEALVNAFACQQLSLEVGLELLNRLATITSARFGTQRDSRYGFPTAYLAAQMIDQVVGWSLAALLLGWRLGRG